MGGWLGLDGIDGWMGCQGCYMGLQMGWVRVGVVFVHRSCIVAGLSTDYTALRQNRKICQVVQRKKNKKNREIKLRNKDLKKKK